VSVEEPFNVARLACTSAIGTSANRSSSRDASLSCYSTRTVNSAKRQSVNVPSTDTDNFLFHMHRFQFDEDVADKNISLDA